MQIMILESQAINGDVTLSIGQTFDLKFLNDKIQEIARQSTDHLKVLQ